jgi:hypothetical protein
MVGRSFDGRIHYDEIVEMELPAGWHDGTTTQPSSTMMPSDWHIWHHRDRAKIWHVRHRPACCEYPRARMHAA